MRWEQCPRSRGGALSPPIHVSWSPVLGTPSQLSEGAGVPPRRQYPASLGGTWPRRWQEAGAGPPRQERPPRRLERDAGPQAPNPAASGEELLAHCCHSAFIVKPRAQPGHRARRGSTGARAARGRGPRGPVRPPPVLEELRRRSLGSGGPALPLPPRLEIGFGPVPGPLQLEPPTSHRHLSSQGRAPLGPQPAPDSASPTAGPSGVCPLASRPVHMAWAPGSCLLLTTPHGATLGSLPLLLKEQHSRDGRWRLWWLQDQGLVTGSRAAAEGAAPGRWERQPGHSTGRGQQRPGPAAAQEGKEGRWVGKATGLEPEAQLSRAPSGGGEFNGRVAQSSQPLRLGPAPLQQTRASPAGRC